MKYYHVIYTILAMVFIERGIAQIGGNIQVTIEGPIHFIVTDSMGRKSGIDSRTNVQFDEIPDVGYGFGGVGSIDTNESVENVWNFGFNETITNPTFKEIYIIEIIGKDIGEVMGNVNLRQTLTGKGLISSFKIVIDSLQSVFYKITYTTDSTIPPTMTKVVDTLTLRQDLDNCYKLNLLRNLSTYQNLQQHCNQIRIALVAGDTLYAEYELFQFGSTLDTVKQDTLILLPDGYQILREDINILWSQLQRTITLTLLPVVHRWNILSVPVAVSNFYKSSVYPTATTPVYTYQHGYVTKDTLANGIGYWVKFGSDQYINCTGLRIDTISVPVVAGWNMIGSLSYDIPTTQIQAVGTNVTSSYLTYEGGGYTPKNTISAGKGYWIKVSGSGTLLLGGLSSSGGQLSAPEPPPAPGSPSAPSLSSPGNGATGQSRTPTLSWSASNGATSYRLQVSTSSSFSTLIVDDATITPTSKQIGTLSYITIYYWRVKAENSNGSSYWSEIWSFTTVGTTPPNPCDPISTMSVLDQFSVTDAEGNTQHLYARQKGRKLAFGHNNEEMPPEPMEGIFHARFQSGKFIENIPHGQGKKKIPIKVKDAVYPITIRWNIKTENKMKYWLTKPGKNQEEIELNNTGSMILESTDAGVIVIQSQVIEPVPCEEEQGME